MTDGEKGTFVIANAYAEAHVKCWFPNPSQKMRLVKKYCLSCCSYDALTPPSDLNASCEFYRDCIVFRSSTNEIFPFTPYIDRRTAVSYALPRDEMPVLNLPKVNRATPLCRKMLPIVGNPFL